MYTHADGDDYPSLSDVKGNDATEIGAGGGSGKTLTTITIC
jgi:hypothetical protein